MIPALIPAQPALTAGSPDPASDSAQSRVGGCNRGRRICWLLSACFFAATLSADDSERVRERLDALRSEIQSIASTLASRRQTQQQEQAALAEAERELGRLLLAQRETESALERIRQQETSLVDQVQQTTAHMSESRQRLAEQLGLAYRSGNRSRLQALLNLDDPGRLSRTMALHGYLGRARIAAIEELERQRRELEDLRSEQRCNAVALEQLLARQKQERESRREAMQRRQQALKAFARAIADDESRLAELHQSEAELQELLDRLSDALADIAADTEVVPFERRRGTLPMPVQARVMAGFSDPRGRDVAWQGWLLQASEGTAVKAVAWGRVAYADWLRGYGMMIIIDHGEGWMTLYGQNRSLTATVGDWVAPGDVIALAGDSGGSETPGLYFQIRKDGRPVDPAGWMVR